jgi:hypothetical protein
MSETPDIYYVLRGLCDAAEEFVAALSPPDLVTSVSPVLAPLLRSGPRCPYMIEGRIATAAWLWLDEWTKLEMIQERRTPRPVIFLKPEQAFGELNRVIDECVNRWGWSWLRTPVAQAEIGQRLIVHVRNHRDLLFDPVLSWVSAKNVGPDDTAYWLADTARARGIQPTMSPEEGEAAYRRLHDRWFYGPALGDIRPEITDEELDCATRGRDALREYVSNMDSPDAIRQRELEHEQIRRDSIARLGLASEPGEAAPEGQEIKPAEDPGLIVEAGHALDAPERPPAAKPDDFEKVPSVRELERRFLNNSHYDVEKTAKDLEDLKIISKSEIRRDKRGRRELWVVWLKKPADLGRRTRKPNKPKP